jgi:serine/threonine protein kinase
LARLYAITISPAYSILMEFFEGGSLYELLRDESKVMDWALTLAIGLDIARGLQHMHGTGRRFRFRFRFRFFFLFSLALFCFLVN